MSPETVEFLNHVSDAHLFSNVGQLQSNEQIVALSSWEEAYKSCNSRAWEDFITDRHNEMTFPDPSDSAFWDTYDRFIPLVRSKLDALLSPVVSNLPIDSTQRKEVFSTTRWHLLGACIETEFKDFTDSIWNLELADWYFRGHFPCGWEGDWPEGRERNGRLIIY